MSYIKNTLNFASYAYNASTNTPSLTSMKDGVIYEVSTAGQLTGTSIEGAQVGADSYLLVGDKVVRKNGAYELLSPKIKNGTTINVGAGGLFATFKDANDYVSQRVYTGVILNLVSATVETASIDVQNPCGGRLVIMGNGFFIDHSGTANTNCTLSGNNIYIDNFKVKANHSTLPALFIAGNVSHGSGVSIQNTNATGVGCYINGGKLESENWRKTVTFLTTDTITVLAGASTINSLTPTASASIVAYSIICPVGHVGNGGLSNIYIGAGGIVITSGSFSGGTTCSNVVVGAITTGGGQFLGGNSCSNYIAGAITTGGGQFLGGTSCSNYIAGAITTGGGQFYAGTSCSNYIAGAITTGGGQFLGGNSCSNVVAGAITTGGGQFSAGDNCQTSVNNTITGVGATFTFSAGTNLYVSGAISGYTIASVQNGIGVYNAATSAGVLRNQNTNILQAN